MTVFLFKLSTIFQKAVESCERHGFAVWIRRTQELVSLEFAGGLAGAIKNIYNKSKIPRHEDLGRGASKYVRYKK